MRLSKTLFTHTLFGLWLSQYLVYVIAGNLEISNCKTKCPRNYLCVVTPISSCKNEESSSNCSGATMTQQSCQPCLVVNCSSCPIETSCSEMPWTPTSCPFVVCQNTTTAISPNSDNKSNLKDPNSSKNTASVQTLLIGLVVGLSVSLLLLTAALTWLIIRLRKQMQSQKRDKNKETTPTTKAQSPPSLLVLSPATQESESGKLLYSYSAGVIPLHSAVPIEKKKDENPCALPPKNPLPKASFETLSAFDFGSYNYPVGPGSLHELCGMGSLVDIPLGESKKYSSPLRKCTSGPSRKEESQTFGSLEIPIVLDTNR